jgi:hypothetical protein
MNISGSNSSNVKKSHSMMDLGNYEKMAADDRAAGEMFFQFVQTLGDKYTDGRDMMSTDSSSSSSRPLSVSSLADHTQTHQSMFASSSSHHTTPSPNAASLILARQFMTIDDVISATVAEDFSSFSMSESSGITSSGSQFAVNESKFMVPSPYRPLPTLSDMSQSSSTLLSSHSLSLSNLLHCDSPLLLSVKNDDFSLSSCATTTSSAMTLNSQEVIQQLGSSNDSSCSDNHSLSGSCSSSSVSRGVADLFVDQSLSAAESERQRLYSEENFRLSGEDNFF